MTNTTSETMKVSKGTKRKGMHEYQPIPEGEVARGTSEKDLVNWWGKGGAPPAKGPFTRKGSQARQLPGGLEPAQEEPEVRLQVAGLDQAGKPAVDRPNLDQATRVADDRSDLDQAA
jgi:hypothetical protein